MKNLLSKCSLLTGILISTFFLLACPDGERMADRIFRNNGLNRLRVVTTRVKPAGILLTKNNRVFYIGEIRDFSGTPEPTFPITDDDAIIEAVDANTSSGMQLVLKKGSSNSNSSLGAANTKMNPAAALDFLNSFLPVSAEGKIKFSGAVKLDQIFAKQNSIKIADLDNFVRNSANSQFSQRMKQFQDAGFRVYLIYESFTSNKLRLDTATNSDIGVNANVNSVVEVGGGFSYQKNSNTSLELDGNTFYTFAIRTARLVFRNSRWSIEPGTFSGSGLAADDERFSVSPITGNSTTFPVLESIQFGLPPGV